MQQNITDRFLDGIFALKDQPLPESARHHARRCLLDYLAATVAGAKMAEEETKKLLHSLGGTDPHASLIGLNRKASLLTASFINGISAHTAELDDGVISGIIHPGAPVFSALIPVAQRYRVNGEDLLLGAIAGYQAAVRIADAIQPSHKLRGYHATATCGALGAVVGILMMRNAAPSIVKNALSAAAVSAAGSLKVLEDNSQLKPINAGHAAASAITAVAIAECGFVGPADVFAGNAGFLAMMADTCDSDKLFGLTDEPLAIERVYFKPYAACRYCHPAIEATLALRAQGDIDTRSIKRIRVSTYELAVKHHDHTAVENVSSAKMSIPFSVAVALEYGAAGVAEYSEQAVQSDSVARVMKAVEVQADETYTAAFPRRTSAKVEITFNDGRVVTSEVHEPKGDPGKPLSDEEVSEKFVSLAMFSGMRESRAREVCDLVWQLPAHADRFYTLI